MSEISIDGRQKGGKLNGVWSSIRTKIAGRPPEVQSSTAIELQAPLQVNVEEPSTAVPTSGERRRLGGKGTSTITPQPPEDPKDPASPPGEPPRKTGNGLVERRQARRDASSSFPSWPSDYAREDSLPGYLPADTGEAVAGSPADSRVDSGSPRLGDMLSQAMERNPRMDRAHLEDNNPGGDAAQPQRTSSQFDWLTATIHAGENGRNGRDPLRSDPVTTVRDEGRNMPVAPTNGDVMTANGTGGNAASGGQEGRDGKSVQFAGPLGRAYEESIRQRAVPSPNGSGSNGQVAPEAGVGETNGTHAEVPHVADKDIVDLSGRNGSNDTGALPHEAEAVMTINQKKTVATIDEIEADRQKLLAMPDGADKDAAKEALQRKGEALIVGHLLEDRKATLPDTTERAIIDEKINLIRDDRVARENGSGKMESAINQPQAGLNGSVDTVVAAAPPVVKEVSVATPAESTEVIEHEPTRKGIESAYFSTHQKAWEGISQQLRASLAASHPKYGSSRIDKMVNQVWKCKDPSKLSAELKADIASLTRESQEQVFEHLDRSRHIVIGKDGTVRRVQGKAIKFENPIGSQKSLVENGAMGKHFIQQIQGERGHLDSLPMRTEEQQKRLNELKLLEQFSHRLIDRKRVTVAVREQAVRADMRRWEQWFPDLVRPDPREQSETIIDERMELFFPSGDRKPPVRRAKIGGPDIIDTPPPSTPPVDDLPPVEPPPAGPPEAPAAGPRREGNGPRVPQRVVVRDGDRVIMRFDINNNFVDMSTHNNTTGAVVGAAAATERDAIDAIPPVVLGGKEISWKKVLAGGGVAGAVGGLVFSLFGRGGHDTINNYTYNYLSPDQQIVAQASPDAQARVFGTPTPDATEPAVVTSPAAGEGVVVSPAEVATVVPNSGDEGGAAAGTATVEPPATATVDTDTGTPAAGADSSTPTPGATVTTEATADVDNGINIDKKAENLVDGLATVVIDEKGGSISKEIIDANMMSAEDFQTAYNDPDMVGNFIILNLEKCNADWTVDGLPMMTKDQVLQIMSDYHDGKLTKDEALNMLHGTQATYNEAGEIESAGTPGMDRVKLDSRYIVPKSLKDWRELGRDIKAAQKAGKLDEFLTAVHSDMTKNELSSLAKAREDDAAKIANTAVNNYYAGKSDAPTDENGVVV